MSSASDVFPTFNYIFFVILKNEPVLKKKMISAKGLFASLNKAP